MVRSSLKKVDKSPIVILSDVSNRVVFAELPEMFTPGISLSSPFGRTLNSSEYPAFGVTGSRKV